MSWNWNTWYKNTQKYPIYKDQLEEVYLDVLPLGQTYLDVGCGKGRLIDKLVKAGKIVDGLDIHYNNFDLLKDAWPDNTYDVVVCNLILCHFDSKELDYIKTKILDRTSNYIYIFDEYKEDKNCCELLDESTHKYYHDYFLHFSEGLNEIYKKKSEVGKWIRQVFKKG